MKDFEVTITETLQKIVTVRAENQSGAALLVQDAWNDGVHILDSEHFVGAKFVAEAV